MKKTKTSILSMLLAAALAFPAGNIYAEETPENSTPETAQEQNPEKAEDTPVSPAEEEKKSQLNLLSYTLTSAKGEEVSSWLPNETCTLTLFLKDAGLKASDFSKDAKENEVIDWIDADHLNDGFKGGTAAEVKLLSSADKPLRFSVTFKDLVWKGASDTFNYSIGYPSLKLDYQKESLQISQCQQPEENTEDSPSDSWSYGGSYSEPVVIAAATPNLIIKKYTYGKDVESVTAGSDFTLSLTFQNTSKSLAVENIVMQIETEEGLSITNSSNTYYFDSLAAGADKTQKIKMKALSTDKTTSPAVSVNFSYEYVDGSTRQAKTCSERIAIPVKQADRFEITAPEITETAYVGQEFILSFPFVNKGKATLYNVAAKVDGDMETLIAVQNLGNYESGRSGSIDVVLTPQTPGEHSFTVVITYEDSDEQETVKEFPFTLSVEEMSFEQEDPFPEDTAPEESHSSLLWVWIVLLAAIAGGIGFLFFKKKKKQKETSPAEEHPEDFDFDSDQNDHAA